jgi:hypothetical protein
VPFISVVLECGLEENVRRLAGRASAAAAGASSVPTTTTTKLASVEILREIRAVETLRTFGDDADLELVLDVTALSPQDAAAKIRDVVVGHLESQSK